MQFFPVVTAKEMAEIEKKSIIEGASENDYMVGAATSIATIIEKDIYDLDLSSTIYIFAGKGNNGGDGLATGEILRQRGFEVVVFALFKAQDSSLLNQQYRNAFKGNIISLDHISDIRMDKGVIIDAIFGIGFEGEITGLIEEVIDYINQVGSHVIAIDIPSGLNGNTGIAAKATIVAAKTIYLGMAKLGYFLEDGMNYVGELEYADFGLAPSYIQQAQSKYVIFNTKEASHLLPKRERKQHKYEAGYTLAFAGSLGMYGAAALSCLAALRSGCGIVRLFFREEDHGELVAFPLEIVKTGYDDFPLELFLKEQKRAASILVGPGLSRTEGAKHVLKALFTHIQVPTVIDADALFFLPQFKEKLSFPKILTPHKGELLHLLEIKESISEQELINRASHYATATNSTVVFKGAATFIIHPSHPVVIMPFGSPSMATAGSGDVLTGVIAAMLSLGLDTLYAATLAVYIHQMAGKIAENKKSIYGVIATDILEAIPEVFTHLS
ncbi:MAG: NAD(P)H-hydrate dehydratase [Chlamydiales bacterium]|nr:NAD(P)H-hydrate dehydratase [Chlamydiales bacterium]